MDVELLVVPDCSNGEHAAVLLRAALDDVGLGTVRFRTTIIATLDEAQRRQFIGSPTILINGDDPFLTPGAQPAIACRTYPGGTGPVGIPELRDLREALKHAADATAPANRG